MSTVLSPANVLPPSQRLRFIRSMKKLGDVLTETSLLVDTPTPSHSRGASASLSPITFSSPADTQSPPSSRNFFSLRLPKTPLSPAFSVSLNSPLTPATPVVDLERKLAKVVATLGENVPPELVFPPAERKGRKRSSTVSVPEFSRSAQAVEKAAAAADSLPPSAFSDAAASVRARRRHRHAAVGMTVKHAASSASLRADVAQDEPFSYSTLVLAPSPYASGKSDSDTDLSSATPTSVLFAPAPSGRAASAMRRKEAGWSGEWSGSVRNMDDVVRGLRELRLK